MPDARVIPLPSAVSPPAAASASAAEPAREPLRSVPDLPAGPAAAASSPPDAADPQPPAVGARLDDDLPEPDRPEPDRPEPDRPGSDVGAGGDPIGTASPPPVLPTPAPGSALLDFLRRRLAGNYRVDEFGFDAELTRSVLMAPMRPLYERYFRVETRGMEHVPDTGAALLVANHSGTLPLDAVMTQLALLDHHPASRHLRMLGADLLFRLPILTTIARKGGVTLACNADSERLLNDGHLVGVWPEGFKGIGKPFSERYKLQRFGRGGFVAAAVRTGVPIIPCAIIGAEEIYPILGNANWLARLLGLPYVPITPTFPWLGALGLVPLPSKWIIEFGEPIDTAGYGDAAADDPMLIFNLTDEIRETIQSTLYKLLIQRRSIFF